MQADRRVLIPGADPTKPRTRAHNHTLQVLQLRAERTAGGDAQWTLLSGGGGGKIKIWRDLDGEYPILKHEVELPKEPGNKKGSSPPGIKVGNTPPLSLFL